MYVAEQGCQVVPPHRLLRRPALGPGHQLSAEPDAIEDGPLQ